MIKQIKMEETECNGTLLCECKECCEYWKDYVNNKNNDNSSK